MTHWELDDHKFYQWAVRKIAEETRIEELEEFTEANPPEKLIRIYKVLDEQVMPVLTRNGIPISREEIHKMFRSWFVKRASPNVQRSDESPTDAREPNFCT